MNKLYENIRSLRKANGWSQEDLAKRMGYTDRSMIAKIESGAVDLAESKIMAFAKVFGVKPSDIMGWENHQNDSDRVTKALDILDRIENLPPDNQKMILSFLDNYRSDS